MTDVEIGDLPGALLRGAGRGQAGNEEAERLAEAAPDARAAGVERFGEAIKAVLAADKRLAELRETYAAEADVLGATWGAQVLEAHACQLEASPS